MAASMSVFDKPDYTELSRSRESWLVPILRTIRQVQPALMTAIDVGCGQGYFSKILSDEGLYVTGIDGRSSNIEIAHRNYPDIDFQKADIEDTAIGTLRSYDLVLCLGLLYHLENPFRAIRNLYAITRHVLVGESRVAPSSKPMLALYEEGPSEDQGLNCIALIPSESCLVKLLYSAGYPFVYLTQQRPAHPQFRSRLLTTRERTCFVASRNAVDIRGFNLAKNRNYDVNIWRRWPIHRAAHLLKTMSP